MVRIPITIKIPVNDAGRPSGLAAAKVAIKDISTGLERVSVRALGLKRPANQLERVHLNHHRELNGQYMATRFPVVSRPRPRIVTASTPSYTVKTITLTLAWPTIPSLQEFGRRLAHAPRKIWLSGAALVVLVAALFFGIHLWRHPSSTQQTMATSAGAPQLVRGTPNYATVLPADKNINQLGGWVRISPPDRSPVYTYVDKIGSVRINVSEQPLPAAFQADTANKVAQLANSYNATDKFTAGNNTTAYVGSSGTGEQSVIFAKNKLLILIKSAAPISNNQWTAYISSLR